MAATKTAKPAKPKKSYYDRERERLAAVAAKKSKAGRDIAPIPPVVDPARRAAGAESFEYFCRVYFPEVFYLGWSPDHRKAIELIETAVRKGGLFAFAMPRGSGKTTLAALACLWAAINGYRFFIVFIGSDADSAKARLETIKTAIESNRLLLEDYPEVCYPIRCLEGIANRQAGQLLNGEPTHISWTADEIILPTVPGLKASGVAIRAVGITGSIRGMNLTRHHDGRSVRPDLVVPDDPQTDESARSPSQCDNRVKTLSGAVLGLAGPGKKISGILPCTVIEKGDMADQILDRHKHPAWRGERWKFVYRWPDAYETLWVGQYAKIRADGLRAGDEGRAATEFYAANREAMDAGAIVAWPARFEPDELSGIQHAINLRLDRGDGVFFAEYQNEPLDPQEDSEALTAEQIGSKTNGYARGIVPNETTHLVAFIDVQKTALFWMVCAFGDDFSGSVVDYGCFPDQNREYFSLREVKKTLQIAMKTKSLEAAIYGGLSALTEKLCGREWKRDDGVAVKIERLAIDANWGESTDVVYKFCRESPHAAILIPSHGQYVGATSRPFNDYRAKKGDRTGDHWRVTSPATTGRSIKRVLFDSNHWKAFAMARLAVPLGGAGCLTMFGSGPHDHKMLIDHWLSEDGVRVEAKGRVVTEFKLKPTRPDNHLLDTLVGCLMAASMQGVSLEERRAAVVKKVVKIKLSDLQKNRKHHQANRYG